MTSTLRSEMYLDRAVCGLWEPDAPRLYPTDAFDGLTLSLVELDLTEDALQTAVQMNGVREMLQPLEICLLDEDGNEGPDIHTIEHSVDVGFLAAAACIKRGLDPEFVSYAAQIGMGHDNGKAEETAQQVIHLPRRITDDEKRRGVHPHPEDGALNAKRAGMHPVVCNGIYCHHGFGVQSYGGNPREAFGSFSVNDTSISPELFVAATIAVADVYHASRSGRPESGAKPRDFAMQLVGNLLVPSIVISNFDSMFTMGHHQTQ